MAKSVDKREEGLFRIDDILEIVKKSYNIKNNLEDKNIKRNIQRFLKDKPYEMIPNQRGGTHYFCQDVIDEMMSDRIAIRYFERISGRKRTYKTNLELETMAKIDFHEGLMQTYAKYDELGLTREEGEFLNTIEGRNYLSVDEMAFLNIKGLKLRSELTEEEQQDLQTFYRFLNEDEEDTKRVEELLHQKRVEIMLTALFNEKFVLDEITLEKDINCYVRGEKYSDPSVTRSYIRLENNKNYYKKKK